ncbi:MAG: aminodeoxychorismate synthase component I [Deltaproteobacteria bacterium]|nr:aminodeoxychorismate synthase component I [Deltaproteobacteria bacterium]
MSYTITPQPYRPLEDALPEVAPYVLLKTGVVTPRDRWSILGWDPWCFWMPTAVADPLRELDALIAQVRRAVPPTDPALPIPLLMGALSYDLGRTIESITASADDPWKMPQAIAYAFRNYLIADEQERRMWSVSVNPRSIVQKPLPRSAGDAGGRPPDWSRGASARPTLTDLVADSEQRSLEGPAGGRTRQLEAQRATQVDGVVISSNFTRPAYLAAVAQIRAMIAAGDCYQVNLSQQCTLSTDRSAATIFRAALQANPAPMMALIDTGAWQIISTSPERLLQKNGATLLSRPIKGTRPRGMDAVADDRLRAALAASAKDHAELAMIIDLVRNDLGRVAKVGSVAVPEPWVIETYANVHHLVASVTAEAQPTVPWSALLRAVFPGGSITGCPKVQAMRVIEQLEGVRRGFYCGSVGYIDVQGNGDWNIAIRTITLQNGTAVLNLGGGIVYDSDPATEYDETLQKGATLFAALGRPPVSTQGDR